MPGDNRIGDAHCHLADLPDQPTRDWFDDGMTPQEAIEMIIENENLPPL